MCVSEFTRIHACTAMYTYTHLFTQAQLAGAVEYTNYINEYPGYDIKPFDGEALALKFWGIWSTASLPLPPGPL